MQSAPLHELRLESRSNIFVMAALYGDGRTVTPVRLRNISRNGALIEAASLPPSGTAIRLSRASLSASGTVMWLDGGKAGLQFDAPVNVAEWLPQGRRGIGQQFVDELFHQKRLGAKQPAAGNPADAKLGLAEELLQLRLSLDRAGETLAMDDGVAARHVLTLQAIDYVGQALGRLAAEATSHSVAIAAAANR